MAEPFLHLPIEDRRDILQTVAARLGQQAIVLEKDVWVCWALRTLFAMPNAHPMAFKGGTSLSKIYGVINRFSEDVDITLDYRYFDDGFDPFAANISKNAIRRFADRLKGYVLRYARDAAVPYINSQLQLIPEGSDCEVTLSHDGEKIFIYYPSAIERADAYLKSSILIELGGRNVIDPNERHTVTPTLSALVADVAFPSSEVTVLSPERTFWEKATLMHVECNRPEFKAGARRLSRHWYDLHMLANHAVGMAAINNRELLEDVVHHKQVFFAASYANYEACLTRRFCLHPSDTSIIELRADYEQMLSAGMIYGDAPSFDDVMAGIRDIERRVNSCQVVHPLGR